MLKNVILRGLRRRMPVSQPRGFCDQVPESYKDQRLKQLRNENMELYPNRYAVTSTVNDVLEAYSSLYKGETRSEVHSVAGIITSIRESGKKLKFIDLWSEGGKIQLKVHASNFASAAEFQQITRWIRRGDRIGVEGHPCRTKAGELSIQCSKVTLLAPCLRSLPSKALENNQKRLRRRYLDILLNPELRTTLVNRSKIISFIRRFLEARQFLEVETPILANSAGGASANPFITHHNELNLDLFMRVAPELYLKQLVIAGFDRVFEIGKLFRNEGIDASHNPEFTSCEFYMAYANYEDLMELTNQMLSTLVREHGFTPRTADNTDLDFTSQYQRLQFLPALENALDTKLPDPTQLEDSDSLRFLSDLCERKDVRVVGPRTVPRLLDKLASAMVEPNLVQPTFLIHQPMIMSPLAKPCQDNHALAERFELYAAGLEVCNAYTELNDPEIQRKTLQAQAGMFDPEGMVPDEEYCTALEYGLPPTAGWGCGIDRLTAILTNTDTIRETITFPLVKPFKSTVST